MTFSDCSVEMRQQPDGAMPLGHLGLLRAQMRAFFAGQSLGKAAQHDHDAALDVETAVIVEPRGACPRCRNPRTPAARRASNSASRELSHTSTLSACVKRCSPAGPLMASHAAIRAARGPLQRDLLIPAAVLATGLEPRRTRTGSRHSARLFRVRGCRSRVLRANRPPGIQHGPRNRSGENTGARRSPPERAMVTSSSREGNNDLLIHALMIYARPLTSPAQPPRASPASSRRRHAPALLFSQLAAGGARSWFANICAPGVCVMHAGLRPHRPEVAPVGLSARH